MSPGILDTNVLVSALTNDAHSVECRDFLNELRDGKQVARLEAMVLHELAYVLLRVFKLERETVVGYMSEILNWQGISCDKELYLLTVESWYRNPTISFVDAYLGSLARQTGSSIYTKNIRDFSVQGVSTPSPLPSASLQS